MLILHSIETSHYVPSTVLALKIARYFGSGAAMINANHREDIQLQVRYTF